MEGTFPGTGDEPWGRGIPTMWGLFKRHVPWFLNPMKTIVISIINQSITCIAIVINLRV